MAHPILRRICAVVSAFAFVAALQLSVMPMALAAAGDGVMLAKSGTQDCAACGQKAGMKAEDCVAMCAAMPAVMLQAPATANLAWQGDWPWASETIAGRFASPDSSPPRS